MSQRASRARPSALRRAASRGPCTGKRWRGAASTSPWTATFPKSPSAARPRTRTPGRWRRSTRRSVSQVGSCWRRECFQTWWILCLNSNVCAFHCRSSLVRMLRTAFPSSCKCSSNLFFFFTNDSACVDVFARALCCRLWWTGDLNIGCFPAFERSALWDRLQPLLDPEQD